MGKQILTIVVGLLHMMVWQGCEYETIRGPVNCDENPVAIALISSEESNCELKDGRIELQASGGAGTYRFKLGEREEQADGVFTDLAAGVYEVSVQDKNECAASLEVTVKNKSGLNISFQTSQAGCNTAEGTVEITPVGGTAPYNFKIDDGIFSGDGTFSGLTRGDHTIVVNDAIGCEVSQVVKVKSGVSFSGNVSQIIENNCAINDCHNGSQFPDFRVFKNIHDNAVQIKILTGNRTMPEEGSLTQAEINTIACWVDDGAPQN